MTPIVLPSPAESLGRGSESEILIGSGTSVPSGVSGVITYNELTMNNRKWLDTIVISKIDGMADPDIRDERENNPQRDGETPFDSFYGGRTLVLNGFIRAYTYDKMKDIEQAVKTAFITLIEKPMVFQGKNFVTTSQIWCKKNAPIVWSDEYTRDDMFRRDFMITVRASQPPFVSLNTVLNNKNMGLVDGFVNGSLGLTNYEFLNGVGSLKIESDQLIPTNLVRKRFGLEKIVVDFPNPLISYEYQALGTFTSSVTGVLLKYIDEKNYIAVNIGAGGGVNVAKIEEGVETSMGVPVAELGSTPIARSLGVAYKVSFEMRDGKIFVSHGPKGFPPTVICSLEMEFADFVKFGSSVRGSQYIDILPGSTSWAYDNIYFGTGKVAEEQIMSVVNAGNYDAAPLITIRGPITGPILANWSTEEFLRFKPATVIPSTDTWIIDIANGIMTDDAGDNMFNHLDPMSDWPLIAPGSNAITLSGSGLGGEMLGPAGSVTTVSISHRHSWS